MAEKDESFNPFTEKGSRLRHLEQMEGWRSQAYVLNDNSGVTIGFGIDFSQPPYDSNKGLQENGFTAEQAEAIMRTGVLGKTVKQLKKENFDFEKIKQITIPDTEETKQAIAKPIFEKVDKVLAPYKDNVTPEVYNALSTIVHFGGGKGKEGSVDSKDPFERKNAAINNIFVKLDQEIASNPNTVLQNRIILDSMEESMKALSVKSPMNSTTLLREMKYIDPSVVESRNLDIYEKKEDETFAELSRRARLRKNQDRKNNPLVESSLKSEKETLSEIDESIERGVQKIGSVELSPEFIRAVQSGEQSIFDKDVENVINSLDADDPFSFITPKGQKLKDAIQETRVERDAEGNIIGPSDEIYRTGYDEVYVGPSAPDETEPVEPKEEPIVYEDPLENQDDNLEEDEEVEILDTKKKKETKVVDKKEDKERRRNLDVLASAAIGLVSGGLGVRQMNKALEDIPIEEGPKLNAAWQAHMTKMRELAQSGLTAEEKASAQADLSKNYNLGVRNVMRAAGGSRAAFLANAGVLNANRVEGLLKLSAMDAAMQRKNMDAYGKQLQFENEFGRKTGEIDRKMAYDEATRKSALHGEIGNALIETALDNVNYAITKQTQAPMLDRYKKFFEQQNLSQDLNTFGQSLERTQLNTEQ